LFLEMKGTSTSPKGAITRAEMLQFIQKKQEHMKSMEDAGVAVAQIMREADTDHSGDISWSEFLEYMTKHENLVFV